MTKISQPVSPRPLMQVRDLRAYFPLSEGVIFQRVLGEVKAVDGVSLDLMAGETLGLVGESGSGKTTTGRCILQLMKPTHGEVIFDGKDMSTLKPEEIRPLRKRLQMIFQDPYGSLNPRMTAGALVEEPLIVHQLGTEVERRSEVQESFERVGLDPRMADRFPHEFSGGQRQRIGIARAIIGRPDLIVCDEPVSALDVSIQAQIVNLLQELQQELNLTYLFIAHDLSVVRHISDRVAVMYLGKIVETASKSDLYTAPLHPYTKALFSAVPIPDPAVESKREHIVLAGDVPSPANPPSGCSFHPRCPMAMDICKNAAPPLTDSGPGHKVACHLYR